MARKDAQPGKAEAAAERRVQALQLRMAGASYRAIGSRLGVSEAQAHRDVHTELTRLAEKAADAAEQVRTLELERLDALLLALWPQAKQANQGAVDRVLRVMERRAKLLGIDAPTKVETKDTTEPVDWDAVPSEVRDAFIAGKIGLDDVRRSRY